MLALSVSQIALHCSMANQGTSANSTGHAYVSAADYAGQAHVSITIPGGLSIRAETADGASSVAMDEDNNMSAGVLVQIRALPM